MMSHGREMADSQPTAGSECDVMPVWEISSVRGTALIDLIPARRGLELCLAYFRFFITAPPRTSCIIILCPDGPG